MQGFALQLSVCIYLCICLNLLRRVRNQYSCDQGMTVHIGDWCTRFRQISRTTQPYTRTNQCNKLTIKKNIKSSLILRLSCGGETKTPNGSSSITIKDEHRVKRFNPEKATKGRTFFLLDGSFKVQNPIKSFMKTKQQLKTHVSSPVYEVVYGEGLLWCHDCCWFASSS